MASITRSNSCLNCTVAAAAAAAAWWRWKQLTFSQLVPRREGRKDVLFF